MKRKRGRPSLSEKALQARQEEREKGSYELKLEAVASSDKGLVEVEKSVMTKGEELNEQVMGGKRKTRGFNPKYQEEVESLIPARKRRCRLDSNRGAVTCSSHSGSLSLGKQSPSLQSINPSGLSLKETESKDREELEE